MYNVSYFCAVGNPTKQNQDRVLVNGTLVNDGLFHLSAITQLRAFVADGVGSMENSGNAAQFVLEQLSGLTAVEIAELNLDLYAVNKRLVDLNQEEGIYRHSATTLCGLILAGSSQLCINVGDSELLFIRSGVFARLTTPQVVDPDVPNSPITSYFGTPHVNMRVDITAIEDQQRPGDLFVITTDGLLKAIGSKELTELLSSPLPLKDRVEALFGTLTEHDAPDNLGVTVVEVV